MKNLKTLLVYARGLRRLQRDLSRTSQTCAGPGSALGRGQIHRLCRIHVVRSVSGVRMLYVGSVVFRSFNGDCLLAYHLMVYHLMTSSGVPAFLVLPHLFACFSVHDSVLRKRQRSRTLAICASRSAGGLQDPSQYSADVLEHFLLIRDNIQCQKMSY